MTGSKLNFVIMDNGGRRSGTDLRHFSYSAHVPERRSGQDRRSGKDRRTGIDRRIVTGNSITKDRRSGIDRRDPYKRIGDRR